MVFPQYRWQDVLGMVSTAVLYAALGKLVLNYFSAEGNVTLVWFPSGLALAVLILKGPRVWPGIFAGALVAGLMVNDGWGLSAAIAVGNTLEPLLATWWLTHTTKFSPDLNKPEHFYYLGIISICCSFISASVGPVAIMSQDLLPVEALPIALLHWWMSDVLGVISVVPVLLVWRQWPKEWFTPQRLKETLAFLTVSVVTALDVFLGMFQAQLGDLARDYWIFVVMFWGATRFARHGVQWVAIVTAVTALLGAASGNGYFAHDFEKSGLVNYWLFQMVFSALGTLLALILHDTRQTSARLAASEHRLQSIIDVSPVSYALIDAEQRITLLNPAFISTFGYTVRDIPSLSDWWEKAIPDSANRNRMQQLWVKRLGNAGRPGVEFEPVEMEVKCKNGGIRHVIATTGQLSGVFENEYLTIFLDVTEQTRIGKALSDSNVFLNTILETLPIRIFWKDKERRYQGANNLFAMDAGCDSVAELVGKTDDDLVWWQMAERYRADDVRVIETGESAFAYEEPQINKYGDLIWLRTSKFPLRNSNGDIIGLLGTYEDITMRKRIEDQLTWRTTFLEALLDSSPAGVLAVDTQGKKLLQNRRIAEFWEIPPEIADDVNDEAQLAFVTDKTKHPDQFAEQVAYLYAHPDQASRDEIELINGLVLERFTWPILDRQNNCYGRIWYFNDITERRNSERNLLHKQYYERALLDNFPFVVWLKDQNCKYLAVNRRFIERYGIDADQVIGKMDFDLFPGRIAKKCYEQDCEVMRSGQRRYREESLSFKGQEQWQEIYQAPLFDDERKVLGTVGFARDISQRKAHEDALKLAASVFENSNEAMLITDADNRILNINPAYENLTGYRREHAIGRIPNILVSAEQQAGMPEAVDQAISATGKWRGLLVARQASGERYSQEVLINAIFDSGGHLFRKVIIFLERKSTPPA
ncbi:PAS domain S-box protein [Methylomonas rhizoryzae]|uniref:PAS domain S-box protein n=1 Tax=Methylomonas rhizoryzae TaxID=2608981 RepID=UPI001E408C3B|nr:PAS domain S-box protein [Methylomonas rhizoryzae]